jgi:hypothetical protein
VTGVTASPPAELEVLPSPRLTAPQLAQAEVIYRQAFPQHLRVPFDELATPGPTDLVLVATVGEPVGLAAMLLLDQHGWTFLRYYGVAAARRREGLGLRFWRQLPAAVVKAGWPARIVFEVEDPREAPDDRAEQQVRAGRIAFWQRCGARLQAVGGYVMPDITGLAAPEPMHLMAYNPAGPAELPRAELTALYSQRYGLGTADPLVARALASIGNAGA